jgi:O-antigen/teichoic acid export membrane protein
LIDSKRIILNTGSLVVSSAIEKVSLYILFLLMAKMLGPESFGQFFIAFTFCNILFIFNELGLTAVVSRAVACDKQLSYKYFSNFMGLRVVSLVISYPLLLSLILVLDYSNEVKNLIYLLSFYFILSYLSHPFIGLFRAFEKMHYIAAMMIADRLVITMLGLGLLFSGFGLFEISIAFIIGGFIRVLVGHFYIVKTILKEIGVAFDVTLWKSLISESFAISIFMILTLFSLRIDTLILAYLDYSELEIGYFNASQLIFIVLVLPATVITQALFPIFSRMYGERASKTFKYFILSFMFMLVLTVPISSLTYIFSSIFIDTIYGVEYGSSKHILEIFSYTVPLYSLNLLVQWLFISVMRANLSVLVVFVLTVVNLVLNFVLIPVYGIEGAAWATFFAHVTAFLISLLMLFVSKKSIFNFSIIHV